MLLSSVTQGDSGGGKEVAEKHFFGLEISLSSTPPLPFTCCAPRANIFISPSLLFKMRLLGDVNGISLVVKSHSQKGARRPALWGKRVVGFASVAYRICKRPSDIERGHEPREERGGGGGRDNGVI